LHAKGIRVPVVGPDALHDPAFAQRAGAEADGELASINVAILTVGQGHFKKTMRIPVR
jgi:hypothetical protein